MKDFNFLKSELVRLGVKYNLCREYIGYINQANKIDDLVKLYFAGDDFCKDFNYPPVHLIEPFKDEARESGLIINDVCDVTGVKKIAAVGESIVNATFKGYDVGYVIAKDNSVVNIFAYDFSKVFVFKMGNALVNCVNFNNAKIKVKDE